MPTQKEMFLDQLIRRYTREDQVREVVERARKTLNPTPKELRLVKESILEAQINEQLGKKLEASNLVLLNGAVVDSLYFLPPNQTDYEGLEHMPFDSMFFELAHSVPFEVERGVEKSLKGILFG